MNRVFWPTCHGHVKILLSAYACKPRLAQSKRPVGEMGSAPRARGLGADAARGENSIERELPHLYNKKLRFVYYELPEPLRVGDAHQMCRAAQIGIVAIEVLSGGQGDIGGAMLPPPEGSIDLSRAL
jgi:hypothetical protein